MNTNKKAIWLAMLLMATAGPALAERSVDETREAAPDGTVSVELIMGSIDIEGWDRAEVRVTGTLGDGVEELEIDSSGRRTSIEVDPRHGSYRDAGAYLKIEVPFGSDIDIEAVSAPIEIRGVAGEVSVESVNGDVTVMGPVPEIDVELVNGKLEFSSDVPLKSGSFEAVSGNIDLSLSLDPSGRLSAEAVSGNIRIELPASTCADFELSTFSGGIDSDFGGEVESSEYLPSKSMEFSTGSCRARVSISSFSGRIELLKR